MTYTTTDYLAAIDRELAKRQSTYPKIIDKKAKRGETPRRISNELHRQAVQHARLRSVRDIIRDGTDYLDPLSTHDYLTELKREMKMRESLYKRFVIFKRITPEVAAEQQAVWRYLVEWWQETYCIPTPLSARPAREG